VENIVSFSGGKDSTAMLLLLIEKGIQIDKIIFCDTTLEFPELYEYIKKIENHIKIPITILKPKNTWDHWFYGVFTRGVKKGIIRGFPYAITPCWWSREAKIRLLDKAQGSGNCVYIGITKTEEKRTLAKQYKSRSNIYKFPLCEWGYSEKDCFKYLVRKGFPHPLSHFKRTGCWLCPKQSKESLHVLYKNYPELWKKLKKYEADSPQGFKHNVKLSQIEDEAQLMGCFVAKKGILYNN